MARSLRVLLSGGLIVPMFVALTVSGPPAAAATISTTRDAVTATAALADSAAGAVNSSSFPVIPAVSAASECSNGLDDDGDGLVDFTPPVGQTADPDCISASDGVETADAPPECSNGFDDDGDALVDFTPPLGETPDPGCDNAADNNEVDGDPNPVAACANGIDDDGDGLIDFSPPAGGTADPGCDNTTDIDEGSEGFPGQVGNPAAVVSTPLAGFPTAGSSFTLLSNGDALLADDPNIGGSSGFSAGGGGGSHGASFYDLVTLKVDISVPAGANCLAFDFKFMSEEFPEYVGASVNDGFVAELDTSDFTADAANNNAVVAPNNFAFDGAGKVISINTAGFSEAEAAGTTYDGSTPLLRASRPVTSGSHSLYLSVFDQGDGILDSTAFLDNLRIFTAPDGGCITGSTSDITPPDTTITSGPAQGSTTDDNTPTFAFTSTETGSTFQCRVDSAAFAACTTPFTAAALSDGQHTFEVRAIDSSGNIDATPASRSFTVDTTPPDTTITAGPSGTTNDNTPTFSFTATETGSTFQCRIDGGAWVSCTSPLTTAALADGAHTFEVRATDAASNTDPTPASRSFTVASVIDTEPPDTTITAGPSGTTNDNTPTFSFTATETGSTFQCRIDGGAWVSCTSPFTTAALADGAHTFEVRATDAASNTDPTPASRSFTVTSVIDTEPPDTTITAGPSGTTNDNTPTFSFTATETGSTFQCRIDGGAWVSCTSPLTTTALADGAHTFEVRATDAASNTDPTPASRSFTVTTVTVPAPVPTCLGKPATIVGTSSHDVLTGTGGSDVIVGLGGKDKINGGGGKDLICGGDGDDALQGAGGNDRIDGGAGNDTLGGGGGNDALRGADGDDVILGNGGDDEADGGAGNDRMRGAAGDDVLKGADGDDQLYGQGGDDELFGGSGQDRLDGGPGRDRGDGGGGLDVIVRCET